jgi:hypothetical protein
VHLKAPDLEVRLFSTIMTLGTPQDVTLQELRIETFFPADEESEARLRNSRTHHERPEDSRLARRRSQNAARASGCE